MNPSEPVKGRTSAAAWSALRTQVRGLLFRRGEPSYEDARRALSWNARVPSRHPAAILRATDADDIAVAVRWAAEQELRVALRSGGHSWCGAALREDALVLDLGALRTLEIDAAARVARAGPAVENLRLATSLAREGLAFPVGHCPSVALGGYLLSGGFGWNSGIFGPACARVRALEIVDARGERLRLDARSSPELFWAARGAGAGFFGVATSFELELAPLPRAIRVLSLEFSRAHAEALEADLAELLARRSAALELSLLAFPASSAHELQLLAVAFGDRESEALELLAPLSPLAARARHVEGPHPASFADLLHRLGAFFPEGRRHGVDVFYAERSAAALFGSVAAALRDAPSPHSLGMVVPAPPLDPAAPLADMALSLYAPSFVGLYAQWEDAHDDAANLAWLEVQRTRFRPLACGHYVGETDLYAEEGRARRCFAPPAFERLCELRERWDPRGVFAGFPLSGAANR
ncbi:MAG: FAD-binding oxidoreductase [Planctomycetes bacterium]|nr:FAD-binding oxidoreductase [Planctomycetota bacterium]